MVLSLFRHGQAFEWSVLMSLRESVLASVNV